MLGLLSQLDIFAASQVGKCFMINGLTGSWTAGHALTMPLLAQFGGGKSYWVDLIIIAVLFALVIFVVGRASRRY